MKRKPIKIDWNDLEEAFSNLQAEATSYLDAITGHVVLEGEGEEDDLLDEDAAMNAVGGPSKSRQDDPTRLPIRPPDLTRRIDWMKGFLGKDPGAPPEVVAELADAIDAKDPNRVRDVLNRNPEVRDAWYAYRFDRLHEMIDEWLAKNGVEPTDPPPWKPE
jgi:hypothetical protein